MRPAYEQFSASDFLSDDAFIGHQLAPTVQSIAYWNSWLQQHPRPQSERKLAVELVKAIQLGLDDYAQTYLSEETIRALLIRIKQTNSQIYVVPVTLPVRRLARIGWVAAACVLLALGVGLWLQP